MLKTTPARRGARFELRVRHFLEGYGWVVFRSAGSRGPVDLVALRAGEVMLIQCKVAGKIGENERTILIGLSVELCLPVYMVKRLGHELIWFGINKQAQLERVEVLH